MGATKESWIKRKLNGKGIAWNKGISNPNFHGKNNPKWNGGEITIYRKVKVASA